MHLGAPLKSRVGKSDLQRSTKNGQIQQENKRGYHRLQCLISGLPLARGQSSKTTTRAGRGLFARVQVVGRNRAAAAKGRRTETHGAGGRGTRAG